MGLGSWAEAQALCLRPCGTEFETPSQEAPLLQLGDERRLPELTAQSLDKLGSPFEVSVDLLLSSSRATIIASLPTEPLVNSLNVRCRLY